MTLAFRPTDPQRTPRANHPLRLGLLCPHDLTNRNAFSGTAYFAAEALAAQPDIEVRHIAPPPRRLIQKVLRRSTKLTRPDWQSFDGLDVVVGLVASRLAEHIPRHLPFLHVTDATPAFLRDTYGWAQSDDAEKIERRAIARADQVIYSSAAMAARAPDDLGLSHIRSTVLPFGVNFDAIPSALPEKPPLERPRLLFVGSQWERKGGAIALDAFDRLRARGINATLTLVGPVPDHVRPRPGLRVEGYLDKNRVKDATRLSQLYAESHLLLLPTRGDCTPMVIAEAMAHGTPVLVTDTGGTADVIGTQSAGRVLPMRADGESWAEAIIDILASHEGFQDSAQSAFDRANTALAWKAWANGIVALAQAVTKSTPAVRPQMVA